MSKYNVIVSHFRNGSAFGDVGRVVITANDDSAVVEWANNFVRKGFAVLVDPIRAEPEGGFLSYRALDGKPFVCIHFAPRYLPPPCDRDW